MATADQIISIAEGELGYSRWDDPQTGTKYGRWYAEKTGSSYYGENGVAFCAMFVSWVFNKAGQACPGLPGAYCPWIVTAGKNSGQTVPTANARKGDVVLFDWGGDMVSDHIGIVESNNGSYLTCLEGNTTGADGRSGAVNRRTRAYSTVVLIIRPKYDGTVTNTPEQPESNNNNNNNSETTKPQTGSITAGTYTIQVNDLKVRTSPSTSASSVAAYDKGNTVILDGWSTTADGYVWGRYIGGSSGQYRYIAVKSENGSTVFAAIGQNNNNVSDSSSTNTTNKPNNNTVSTSVPAGTYKVIVDNLNVRTAPTISSSTVAQYSKNETIVLDNYSKVADGYVWGRYTGNSGNQRYIAVRTTNGTVYAQKI